MFTISLVGQKGGTGKSTACLGLAVEAARAGHVAAVIDIDPQASAAAWHDRRQDKNPPVVSAQASRLRQTLDAAAAGGVEYAFIDTAGRSDASALSAARAADLVLIPSRPNIQSSNFEFSSKGTKPMNNFPPLEPTDGDLFDFPRVPAKPILQSDGTIKFESLPGATAEEREVIARMHLTGCWHEPQPGVFERLPVN